MKYSIRKRPKNMTMTTREPAFITIPNLIFTYAERIDAGDFQGVAELFEYATITTEGSEVVHRGAEEIRSMYESWARRYEDGTPRTKHVTSNLILEIDEDAASAAARSYFTVFQQTDRLSLQPIIVGRYHDRFECIGGRWRFVHRHMISDLFGDLSHHLLQAVIS